MTRGPFYANAHEIYIGDIWQVFGKSYLICEYKFVEGKFLAYSLQENKNEMISLAKFSTLISRGNLAE